MDRNETIISFVGLRNITQLVILYDYYFQGIVVEETRADNPRIMKNYPSNKIIVVQNSYIKILNPNLSVDLIIPIYNVEYLEVFPDGKFVIVIKRKLIVYDSEGNILVQLIGHTDSINCVMIIKDKIVSGSSDNTVRIWNLQGDCEAILGGHAEPIIHLDQLSDGTIVSGDEDNTIRIWGTPHIINNFYWELGIMFCILPDDRIVYCSSSTNVEIWSPKGAYSINDDEKVRFIFLEENKIFINRGIITTILNSQNFKVIERIFTREGGEISILPNQQLVFRFGNRLQILDSTPIKTIHIPNKKVLILNDGRVAVANSDEILILK